MLGNDPAVVAQVRAAFDAYEKALLENDLDAIDAWFHDGEDVVRLAFGRVELGAAAVAVARRSVASQTEPRTAELVEVRAWSADVAGVYAVFRLDGSGRRVHQSQTWVRSDGRWRVAAAHVSTA